jgi:hypothetical protein
VKEKDNAGFRLLRRLIVGMLCSNYVSEVASLFSIFFDSGATVLSVWVVGFVNSEKLVISVLIRDRVFIPNIHTAMVKLCSAANNFAPQTIGPIAAAKRRVVCLPLDGV